VAMVYSSCKFIIRYSTIGVLPLPPTARLPTDIMGISNDVDLKIPIA
jgi:hypothetical protein